MNKPLELLRSMLGGRTETREKDETCVHCGAVIVRGNPRVFRNGWAHRESEDDVCELYAQPKTEAIKSDAAA